jgi:hypothetical protein
MSEEPNTDSNAPEEEYGLAGFLRKLQPLFKRAEVDAPAENWLDGLIAAFGGSSEKTVWKEESEMFEPLLKQLEVLNNKLEAGHALTQEEKASLAELHERLIIMKDNAVKIDVQSGVNTDGGSESDNNDHTVSIDNVLAQSTLIQERLSSQAGQAIGGIDIGRVNEDGSITTSSKNLETGVVTSGKDGVITQAEIDHVIGEDKNGIVWDEKTRTENAVTRANMRAQVDTDGSGVVSEAEVRRAIEKSGLQKPSDDMVKAVMEALNVDAKPTNTQTDAQADTGQGSTNQANSAQGEANGKGRALGTEKAEENKAEKDPLAEQKEILRVLFMRQQSMQGVADVDAAENWKTVEVSLINKAAIDNKMSEVTSRLDVLRAMEQSKQHAQTMEKAAFGASFVPVIGNFAPLLKIPGLDAAILEAGKRMFGSPVVGVGENGEPTLQYIPPMPAGPAPDKTTPEGARGQGAQRVGR